MEEERSVVALVVPGSLVITSFLRDGNDFRKGSLLFSIQ